MWGWGFAISANSRIRPSLCSWALARMGSGSRRSRTSRRSISPSAEASDAGTGGRSRQLEPDGLAGRSHVASPLVGEFGDQDHPPAGGRVRKVAARSPARPATRPAPPRGPRRPEGERPRPDRCGRAAAHSSPTLTRRAATSARASSPCSCSAAVTNLLACRTLTASAANAVSSPVTPADSLVVSSEEGSRAVARERAPRTGCALFRCPVRSHSKPQAGGRAAEPATSAAVSDRPSSASSTAARPQIAPSTLPVPL